MADLMTQAPTTNPNRPTRRASHHKSLSEPALNPFESDDTMPPGESHDSSHSRRQQTVHSSNVAGPSDLMLRNIVIAVTLLMAAFMFLHAALYVGIFVVGVLAPAWRTFKSMEGRSASNVVIELLDSDEDDANNLNLRDVEADSSLKNWQQYWVLFALLFTVDALIIRSVFSSAITSPIHNTIAFSLLSWLTKNRAVNAASVYKKFVRPSFLKLEDGVDSMAATAMVHMDRASQEMIVLIHEAITPVVRQLEQAATVTTAQIQQQQNKHVKSRRNNNNRV
ncbi:unnamed protein product [Agarophyton chilense]